MYSEDPTSCVEEEEKERRGEGTRFGRRKNVGKYERRGEGGGLERSSRDRRRPVGNVRP